MIIEELFSNRKQTPPAIFPASQEIIATSLTRSVQGLVLEINKSISSSLECEVSELNYFSDKNIRNSTGRAELVLPDRINVDDLIMVVPFLRFSIIYLKGYFTPSINFIYPLLSAHFHRHLSQNHGYQYSQNYMQDKQIITTIA